MQEELYHVSQAVPCEGTAEEVAHLPGVENGVASNAVRASPLDMSVGIWPDDDGDVWLYGGDDDSDYDRFCEHQMDEMFAPNEY